MKIKSLDGLRGLAALTVTIAHLPQITDYSLAHYIKFFLSYSKAAYIAVDIFLILSGFLITRILLKNKRENNFSFKQFYKNRFLRIYPIYYLTILLVGIFISWDSLGYVALFLSNYYFPFHPGSNAMLHTWTLAVENQFYLIWPFIVYYVSPTAFIKHWWKFTLPFIAISIIVFYTLFPLNLGNELVRTSTNTRILSLIIGAVVAYNEYKFRNFKKTNILLIGSIILFFLVFLSNIYYYFFNPLLVYYISTYIFATLGSTCLFLFVLNSEKKNNITYRLFSSKPLTFLGLISYALYLYHYPIYHLFHINGTQIAEQATKTISLEVGLSALLLSIIASIASYYLIEKPILKLKR